MSLAQQIRDAMRRLGGPATAREIAEQVEDETDAHTVSKRLTNALAHGWVHVDRSDSPVRYVLIDARAAKVESDPRGKYHDDKPARPGKAKQQLKQRQARATSPTQPAAALSGNIAGAPNGRAGNFPEGVTPRPHNGGPPSGAAPYGAAIFTPRHAIEPPVLPTADPRSTTHSRTVGCQVHVDEIVKLHRAEFLDLAALALAACQTEHAELRIARMIKAHA